MNGYGLAVRKKRGELGKSQNAHASCALFRTESQDSRIIQQPMMDHVTGKLSDQNPRRPRRVRAGDTAVPTFLQKPIMIYGLSSRSCNPAVGMEETEESTKALMQTLASA